MRAVSTSRRESRSSRSATTSERRPDTAAYRSAGRPSGAAGVFWHDVSFSVTAGEALVLRGPNGAGKTTLLRTIAGYVRPGLGTDRSASRAWRPTRRSASSATTSATSMRWKAQLTVTPRNLDFWRRYLGDATAPISTPSWNASASMPSPMSPPPTLVGRPEAATARWPGFWWRTASSGCSTSRRSRSTRDGTATLAAMAGEHCARGGLVIAATHIDLGIAGARELRLAGRTEASWAPS